jgi:hypothetical protein
MKKAKKLLAILLAALLVIGTLSIVSSATIGDGYPDPCAEGGGIDPDDAYNDGPTRITLKSVPKTLETVPKEKTAVVSIVAKEKTAVDLSVNKDVLSAPKILDTVPKEKTTAVSTTVPILVAGSRIVK